MTCVFSAGRYPFFYSCDYQPLINYKYEIVFIIVSNTYKFHSFVLTDLKFCLLQVRRLNFASFKRYLLYFGDTPRRQMHCNTRTGEVAIRCSSFLHAGLCMEVLWDGIQLPLISDPSPCTRSS